MEDDFYATLKFKNGEEIFAKIASSEAATLANTSSPFLNFIVP